MPPSAPAKVYLALTPFFRDPTQEETAENENLEAGFYHNVALSKLMECIRPGGPPLPLIVECIRPGGPPLPLIVECREDHMDAITKVIEIIKELHEKYGGASNGTASQFVTAFVREAGNLVVLPHIPVFYGILASPTHQKLLTTDKKIVEACRAGNDMHTVFQFDSFIEGLVYLLGGGNLKLRDIGLHRWVGKRIPSRGETNKAPRPELSLSQFLTSSATPPPPSPPLIPHTPARGTSQGVSRRPKSRSNTILGGNESDIEFLGFSSKGLESPTQPATPLSHSKKASATINLSTPGTPTPSTSRAGRSVNSTPRTPGSSKAVAGAFIPAHFLQDYRFMPKPIPFAILRSTDNLQVNEVVHLGDHRVKEINRPLPTSTTLPPFVEIYLRVHGWNNEVIKLVSRLHSEEVSLADFLVEMGLAQVPVLEAYFMWLLINKV